MSLVSVLVLKLMSRRCDGRLLPAVGGGLLLRLLLLLLCNGVGGVIVAPPLETTAALALALAFVLAFVLLAPPPLTGEVARGDGVWAVDDAPDEVVFVAAGERLVGDTDFDFERLRSRAAARRMSGLDASSARARSLTPSSANATAVEWRLTMS